MKVHAILPSTYEIEVRRGNVLRNPCRLVEPPRLPQAGKGALSISQARAVIAMAEKRRNAKCAPIDDHGHRWWLGAIDGGADRSGGYGRFQAGRGRKTSVITTAHRYAWTLAHGPVPPGLVVRHRCDEQLCTAEAALEVGTAADNRWDTLARPYRPSDLDTRGSAGRSRAIRDAVLAVLATGVTTPEAIGAAARAAMRVGDPNRDQLTLWPVPHGYLTVRGGGDLPSLPSVSQDKPDTLHEHHNDLAD